ncbi:MAG: SDR family oxidoreductase [Syntrophobacteraceae bacterium]
MERIAEEMDRDTPAQAGDFDVSGRTVVMTGATGVLGTEMARALAARGANVAVLARDLSRAESLRKHLEQGPGRCAFFKADVLRKDSLLEAREGIRKEFGAVYGLINLAGGNQPQATTGPDRSFFDLPEESLRSVMDLNLLGTVLPCQVFAPEMIAGGGGSIVNISSMSAIRPLTRTVAYCASKAAVTNFTQWLAVHVAREYSPAVRVNALAPGFFHTSQNHYLLYDEKSGALTPRGASIVEHTPMGRFGKPGDLIGALLWLLSPASEFVTGALIPVDGGFSAYSGV